VDRTEVRALEVYDDGSGAALYVAGDFDSAGGMVANEIARWDRSGWRMARDLDGTVRVLTEHDDGGGPSLYVGGTFTRAGGADARGIARWNGSSWSALRGLFGDPGPWVFALKEYDDGSGPALYAGGDFYVLVASRPREGVAKWDGSSWSIVGSGMSRGFSSPSVFALTAYDDGSGPALYAGGGFTTAGGVSANNIARWNGSTWSNLGSGVNGFVYALTEYDDGSGPALFAGGNFTTAGGVSANRIARWNGSSWSALGGGMNHEVYALAVFDDGSGPALFAGGNFTIAGGVRGPIARWNGSSWSALGGFPNSQVRSLALFDDGSGPALFVGGNFTAAGGVAAKGIVKWDGSIWKPLGGGFVSHRGELQRPDGLCACLFRCSHRSRGTCARSRRALRGHRRGPILRSVAGLPGPVCARARLPHFRDAVRSALRPSGRDRHLHGHRHRRPRFVSLRRLRARVGQLLPAGRHHRPVQGHRRRAQPVDLLVPGQRPPQVGAVTGEHALRLADNRSGQLRHLEAFIPREEQKSYKNGPKEPVEAGVAPSVSAT
jgi:hypothetical protein